MYELKCAVNAPSAQIDEPNNAFDLMVLIDELASMHDISGCERGDKCG